MTEQTSTPINTETGRPVLPFTAERARDEALGAAIGWIDGWTAKDPQRPDEPQRRVRVRDQGTEGFEITVESAPYVDEPDRVFRIHVTAEELPADLPREREGT
jgi:hypothetical protein